MRVLHLGVSVLGEPLMTDDADVSVVATAMRPADEPDDSRRGAQAGDDPHDIHRFATRPL